ncbi:MAG: peptide chain release factor-like protein [Spirochaetales bacterium]|nr:peptide chain release factor-like protein [Spirochaetales bacterium]
MTKQPNATPGSRAFPVGAPKAAGLSRRMDALGVREEDLLEQFVRSGGKGGQNVNKVATCVKLKHLPTGIAVQADTARTQGLNRYLARKRLLDKLEEAIKGKESEARKKIEKIRRQKRRRSARARAKMVADKRKAGATKALRGPVRNE